LGGRVRRPGRLRYVAPSTREAASGGQAAIVSTGPARRTASALALGNFDGDGDTDLAVTNLTTDTVSIIRNTSTAVAEVMLRPASVDFGSQIVNTASLARAVKVTNVGDANLRVTDVVVVGVDSEDFELTSQSCLGRTIVPGGECIARLVFAPTTQGARAAGLQISSNALAGPHTANLRGSGVMPSCFGMRATIVGTDGSDVVTGTSGNDVVALFSGDDMYDPFLSSEIGGDDWVCGGGGDDTLIGNFDADAGSAGGDDRLFGGSDDDVLQGESGEDFLRGGSGDDFLDGGADGPDAGDDFDQCFGDSGTDASAECESLDGFP